MATEIAVQPTTQTAARIAVEVRDVRKVYQRDTQRITVLDGIKRVRNRLPQGPSATHCAASSLDSSIRRFAWSGNPPIWSAHAR